MLNQIKQLLRENQQLQQRLSGVANLAEAVELVLASGIEKGYKLTVPSVESVLRGVTEPQSNVELSEEDLLAVAGGTGAGPDLPYNSDYHGTCASGIVVCDPK